MRKKWAVRNVVVAFILFAFAVAHARQDEGPVLKPKPKPKLQSATLIVICDFACNWKLDGEAKGHIDAGASVRVKVDLGEHIIAAATEDGQDTVQQMKEVKLAEQKVVSIELKPLRDQRLKDEQDVLEKAKRERQRKAEQEEREKAMLEQQRKDQEAKEDQRGNDQQPAERTKAVQGSMLVPDVSTTTDTNTEPTSVAKFSANHIEEHRNDKAGGHGILTISETGVSFKDGLHKAVGTCSASKVDQCEANKVADRLATAELWGLPILLTDKTFCVDIGGTKFRLVALDHKARGKIFGTFHDTCRRATPSKPNSEKATYPK